METELVTEAVGPAELPDLARLFDQQRSTRRCWCTAFCSTSTQFALGWLGGGNRRRFEALAGAAPVPMGVLASAAGTPVGWGACGPRARYTAALDGRSSLLASRPRDEDDQVWLLPCLLVHRDFRGRGVTTALVRAATELARQQGASALEAWPLAASAVRPGEAFLGREELFAGLGFVVVDRPLPHRVVMRLALPGGSADTPGRRG